MACFVTYDLSIFNNLCNLFRGCGLIFDITGPKGRQFISVRLPNKRFEEQASLLEQVYQHANRLAR